MDELPESKKLELVTIHPGFIIGPTSKKDAFTSGEVIKKLMLRECLPLSRQLMLGLIDVRDVAKGSILAL